MQDFQSNAGLAGIYNDSSGASLGLRASECFRGSGRVDPESHPRTIVKIIPFLSEWARES